MNIMERIDRAKEDVCLSEKEIASPTEDGRIWYVGIMRSRNMFNHMQM